MIKRMLSLLLILCMVLTMLPVVAIAAETVASGTCGDNLTWMLTDGVILSITGTGPMWDYSEENLPPWMEIRGNIQAVIIQNGVTSIGDFAFVDCGNLVYIEIPNTVTSIGDMAFFFCRFLPEVTIPESVVSIGNGSFNCCVSLTGIQIPESVTSIGMDAFGACENLTSFSIPEAVNHLGEGFLGSCKKLETIEVASGNQHFLTDASGALYTADYSCLLAYPATSTGAYTINPQTKRIGKSAFEGCEYLTNITIPSTVTSIGEYAFSGCNDLEELFIPEGVTTISRAMFQSCSSLTSLDIPENVTTIEPWAFNICSSLEELVIPDGVTSIEECTFQSCRSLTKIDIPKGVTNIGNSAFGSCERLEKVWFNGSAPTIAESAFGSVTATCYYPADDSTWTTEVMQNYGGDLLWQGISEVTNSGQCGENLTWRLDSEGILKISGTGDMSDFATVSDVPWDSHRDQIKQVFLDARVTSIGNFAFAACNNLTDIELPKDLTRIGMEAFSGCSKINRIVIPNGVTEIAEYTFSGCESLEIIVIPKNITNIGDKAFGACKNLKTVIFEGSAPKIGSYVFSDTETTCYYSLDDLTWDSAATQNYGGTIEWVPKLASGAYGSSVDWLLDSTGMLMIFGTGKMQEAVYTNYAPWYDYRNDIKTVAIADGITTVDSNAFKDCIYLNSIVLPDSITAIYGEAFRNCQSLTSISIPEAVTVIDIAAFEGCSSLTEIKIPDGVTDIRMDTFKDCTSLASVTLPDSIVRIHLQAFYRCMSLQSINIPKNVSQISFNVFAYCTALENVTISNAATHFDDQAFLGCNSLTSITFPENVTNIDSISFAYCSSLDTITFEGNAPKIDGDAFINVTATCYYPANDTTWVDFAKDNYGGNLAWVPYNKCSHSESIDEAVNPTCTKTGLTEGSHCDLCGKVLVEQVVVDALGHDMVTDTGYAATCTETGLTDGKHCTRCDEETVEQEEIPTSGHNYVHEITEAPEMTKSGKLMITCSWCSDSVKVILPSLNTDEYTYEVTQAPTHTEEGVGTYTWKETAYGTIRITVPLDKLAMELKELSVAIEPNKTVYRLGESLDTTGLVLHATYSDGSIRTVTSGYRVSSFDSSTAGEKTIIVNYEGRSTTFQVTVLPMTAEDPRIVVSNKQAVLGGTVNVTISLKNNPGIASMMLAVGYDPEVLQLQSVTDAGKLGESSHSDNYDGNPYILTWENDLAREDFVVDGEIVTLTFLVAEDAPVGSTAVTVSYNYDNYDIFNAAGEEVWFATVNGSVEVVDVLLGDVNSDGKVNTQDRMILSRYLAKWSDYPESIINMKAADVNCDGKVNTQDRTILARHLAKWTGYETLG